MCQFRWYIVTWILLVIFWQLRLFVQFCEWYFSGCLFLCFFGFLSHAYGHIDLLDAYLDILISHAMKNMAASHSFRNWIHLYLLFNQLISCTQKMKNINLIEYFFLILALHLFFLWQHMMFDVSHLMLQLNSVLRLISDNQDAVFCHQWEINQLISLCSFLLLFSF